MLSHPIGKVRLRLRLRLPVSVIKKHDLEQEIFESFGIAGFKLDRRRRQPNRKVSNDF